MKFKLKSDFEPTGDQPRAIDQLISNIKKGYKHQVLLGVTGSGKTFTMANVIRNLNMPALVISHNKTLAAQLYQELRDFFPENAVSYFVSYYDYYQPEAYIPRSDTYIEKETEINEEIDKLRLAATTNLLTRKDTIVVASVSCIYNIGSPREYGNFVLEIATGVTLSKDSITKRLVDLQYVRSNFDFKRGTFRDRGETIDIYPAYLDNGIRLIHDGRKITGLFTLDPLNGKNTAQINQTVIYPAKHYMTDTNKLGEFFGVIRDDLSKRVKELQSEGKDLEAHRLNQRVNFDLEMIQELGYVNGIENYSRYFDKRKPGDPPYTLFDYYQHAYANDWLLFIDESHMSVPQIRGMYNGDRSRKQVLIDFGFRLPAALDNRPLTFVEFQHRQPTTIYVSATPSEWELEKASGTKTIVEQLIRPTGITDPKIIIRPTAGQIDDLVGEIIIRKKNRQRVLVTTLTKRMAEDLTAYLNDHKYTHNQKFLPLSEDEFPQVQYLHSDIQTLERSDILDELRNGKYDVLIGINLLREGLDLPEVSLVAILDADKEGFLRSRTSLIQTMGRAARHTEGTVIMYADQLTGSMKKAIEEIDRRRNIQINYNKKHHITARTISKPMREKLIEYGPRDPDPLSGLNEKKRVTYRKLLEIDTQSLTPYDRSKLVGKMEKEMKEAAGDLNFELAAEIRDRIIQIKYE